jgi:hypothetical protein
MASIAASGGTIIIGSMHASVDEIVRLFVKKERRDRLLTLAAKASRWGDFRHDLLHDTRSLDASVMHSLAGGLSIDAVAQALRAAGAGEQAYCVSELLDVDGREQRVLDALQAVVGRSQDSLVFVIGTRAAYHENHEGERFILHNRKG